MKLSFSGDASTASPPPEPNEGSFVEAYQWLVEQQRYLSQVLPPLDHHVTDQRQRRLFCIIARAIAKFDRIKQREWNKYVLEAALRSLQDQVTSGPQVVNSGS